MLSEQDVDRELKAALSVSPSPDFEARVRQRVEADRPSRWPAHYRWLAAAASIVIVAGAIYALTGTSSSSSPPVVAGPPAATSAERPGPRVEMPWPEAPVRKNTGEPPRARTVRVAVGHLPAPRAAEPEVLVAADQMDAVRRLVRAATEGRPFEPPAEPLPGPMTPPATVDVAPLVVQPIPLSPLGPGTETATPFIRGIK